MRKLSAVLGTAFAVAFLVLGKSAWSAESLLDKLYRLIWPLGRFDGDLAKDVARNSEKATAPGGPPRLYVVDATSRSWVELPSARGSVDAVACPDGQQVFYRRKTNLVRQLLKLDSTTPDAAPATNVEGASCARLFACVADGSNGVALWTQAMDGKVQILRYDASKWSWASPPGELGDPTKAAESLSLMRAARPDGTLARIRDRRLIGHPKKGAATLIIDDAEAPLFYGTPQWLGTSQRILVAGSEGTR